MLWCTVRKSNVDLPSTYESCAITLMMFKTLQGFGEQISHLQIGTPAFREALLRVLTDPIYTRAAQTLSVKLRARKRTPVQEAAGESLYPFPYLTSLLSRHCDASPPRICQAAGFPLRFREMRCSTACLKEAANACAVAAIQQWGRVTMSAVMCAVQIGLSM